MIRVTRQQCEAVRSIGITGHAGYAEHGKDIVCAAASMLLFTLIEYLEKSGVKHSAHAESGCAGVAVTDPDRRTEDAFDLVETGLRMLAERYPDYVELGVPYTS